MNSRTFKLVGVVLLALGGALVALYTSRVGPFAGPGGSSASADRPCGLLCVVDRVTGADVARATWTLIARRGAEHDAEAARRGEAPEETYDEGFEQGTLPKLPSAEGMRRAVRIAVGAYGHEVRILELAELARAAGRVALDPILEVATLRLETDDDGLLETPVQLSLTLRDPSAPTSAVSLWWLHRELDLTRDGLAIPVGKGLRIVAYAMAASGPYVTWPFPGMLAPGRPTVLHLERTRTIGYEQVSPTSETEGTPSGAERPRGGPEGHGWLHLDPRHVATLSDERRSGLSLHGSLGGYESAPTTTGPIFRAVPRVPLTGVVHEHGAWRAVELDADTTVLEPAKRRPPLRWLRTISIDGEAPPEGTIVLPGTLADDLVNAVLARAWLDVDGLGLRLPSPDAFTGAFLPAADTLTAWHRQRGLARLVWSKDGTALGAWAPGCVRVTAHPGRARRIVCSIRSGFVGSSNVQSGTSRADGMERAIALHGDTLVRGVPFGPVAIEILVELAGEAGVELLHRRVVLDLESPCARFTVTETGTVWFDGTGPTPVLAHDADTTPAPVPDPDTGTGTGTGAEETPPK